MSKNAQTLKQLRAAAVAAGLCQQCRCRPQKPGRVTCEHCLAAHRERGLVHRDVGLCDCGREPAAGRTRCRRCQDADNRRARANRAKRKALGLCWNCSAPVVPGRAGCAKHLAEAIVRAKKHHADRYERGVCQRCRWPRMADSRWCARHRRINTERWQAFAAKSRAA